MAAFLPMRFISYLTILPTTKVTYSKLRCQAWCLFGLPFSMYVLTFGAAIVNSYTLLFTMMVSVALFMVFTIKLESDKPPSSNYFRIVQVVGILNALSWNWWFCDNLVNIIRCLNLIFNYHYTFMMIGIFSGLIWGPVYMGTLKIVRQTKSVPGLSGVIFNSTFVPGICICLQTLLYGSQDFEIFPISTSPSAIHLYIYLQLIMIIFVMHIFWMNYNNYRYNSCFGAVLFMIYVVVFLYTITEAEILSYYG